MQTGFLFGRRKSLLVFSALADWFAMDVALSLADLESILPDAEGSGDWRGTMSGVASLGTAKTGDLSFLGNPRYAGEVAKSAASVILVPLDFSGTPRAEQRFLRVKNPSFALTLVCERLAEQVRVRPAPGIHPSAVVDASAEIDPTATIGPGCVIEAGARIGAQVVLQAQNYVGREVVIGAQSWLFPQSVVYEGTRLGERVILHSGVVLGSDGFGYESGAQGHRKVPQIGIVVIEDDVEIGSNSTIDRARLEETRIGQGTKIDNLVQIGHNVRIGKHCFLCSLAGISGSTKIGDFVVVAGQAGTVGHIEIGDRCQVAGQAGVAKSLPPGSIVTGTPATDFQRQRRLEALTRKLPDLFARVKDLEKLLVEPRTDSIK
jgi:UDP-3-O-[3-hydroxymyristoyl] glucosamine N-acyltransferase